MSERAVRWLRWAPPALAGAYLVALAAQFQAVIATIYLNADAASAPVIGTLAGHGNGAIVLGNLPWYSTLLFELATRGLPAHRALWEAAPYALALASFALIADALRRVSGRLAAVLAASLLICASPPLLQLLFSLNDHSSTWFTIALLGWWVVVLQRAAPRSRAQALTLLGGGLAIAFVAGVNAASDNLLIVGGLAPLVAAGALPYALTRTAAARVAAVAALSTAALAGALALLTAHTMRAHGVTYTGHFAFGEGARVQANLTLLWQGLALLGNGGYFGTLIGFTSVLAAACALIVLTAAVGAVSIGWRELHGPLSGRTADHPDAGRAAFLAFWLTGGVLLSIAFADSSAPENLASSRYLVGVLYAVIALAVLFVERGPRARALVLGGAILYCVAGTLPMARGAATENPAHLPTDAIAAQVAVLAAREHLTRGYAGYWDAAPITWASHMRVRVYPVYTCAKGLCEFDLHTIAGWYRPHPGVRTFLLTDSVLQYLNSPPASLGRPLASYPIGQVTMYVYPYDIATRIAPPEV